MDLTIPRDAFAQAVARAAVAVPTRPRVPVTAGLRLTADPTGSLTVAGFDYEESATATTPADVTEPGDILIPGRLLLQITKALPAAPVTLTARGAHAQLTCGSAKFKLPLLPLMDYPALPPQPGVAGHVDATVFRDAISRVALAADKDDALPQLACVRLSFEDDTIVAAATDRYRFGIARIPWKPSASGTAGAALVPATQLLELAKSLDGDLVELHLDEKTLGLSAASLSTTARQVSEQFPKYESLIPTDFTGIATVSTSEFVAALERVALVAEPKTPVRLAFSDGQCVLETGGGDTHGYDIVPADLEGDGLEIAFNPGFLLDGLKAAGTLYTQFNLTTPTKLALLQGRPSLDEDADPALIYLIMPVRLPKSE